jgi:hypothetical protein
MVEPDHGEPGPLGAAAPPVPAPPCHDYSGLMAVLERARRRRERTSAA